MGKKRSRQSSNGVITGDSSESDGSKTLENNQEAVKVCPHAGKSVEQNQVKKNLHLEDIENNNFCSVCSKLGQSLQGEDLWVCLRCGVKACSLDHSLKHHEVPHSDSHALSLKLTGKIVWCHVCKTEIPSSSNKKLKGCVNNVENLYEKHLQGPAPPKNNVHLKVDPPAVAAEETDINKSKDVPILPAKLKTSIPGHPVRGLWNLGNTCFFNSVIQCLAQTPNLVSVLKDMETPDREVDIQLKSGKSLCGRLEKWDSLTESLAGTLTEVKTGGSAFSPNHLLNLLRKRVPQFRGGDQHDAHELLRHLLDSVRGQDLKRYRRLMLNELGLSGIDNMEKVDAEKTKQLKQMDREVTEVISLAPEQVFRGFLVSRLECQECNSSSECVESFLDLSLPVMSEKPQPPALRRKGCGGSSDEKSGAAGNQMSKHQLKKERKLMRKKHGKHQQAGGGAGAGGGKREEGQGETAPPPLPPPSSEKGGDSDVDGDAEDSDGSDRRRRASAALDRSGQEEVCSGLVLSPACLRPLSAPPQPLHHQDYRLHLKDGLPDLSRLHIRDEEQHHLRIFIRNSSRILKEDPDWSSRLKNMSDRRFTLDRRRSGESPVEEVNGNQEEEMSHSGSSVAPEVADSAQSQIEHRPGQGTEEAAKIEAEEKSEVVKEDNNKKCGEVEKSEEDEDEGSVVGTANLEQILEENEEEEAGAGGGGGGHGGAGGEEEGGSVECSVLSCLAQFTGVELMTGSNKVGCEACTRALHNTRPESKEPQTVYTMSTKQLLISEAPPVLILHLKRFQLLMSSFRKLSKHVSFPLLLDLAPFCQKDCKKRNRPEDLVYSLYGLVEHSGTLNGGHYVAYIKAETGRWYCISDSHVTEVTESRILQVQAYLLFYKRSSLPPPSS